MRVNPAIFFKDKRESTLVSIHVHPTELFKSLVMTNIGFIDHNSPENQALVDLLKSSFLIVVNILSPYSQRSNCNFRNPEIVSL